MQLLRLASPRRITCIGKTINLLKSHAGVLRTCAPVGPHPVVGRSGEESGAVEKTYERNLLSSNRDIPFPDEISSDQFVKNSNESWLATDRHGSTRMPWSPRDLSSKLRQQGKEESVRETRESIQHYITKGRTIKGFSLYARLDKKGLATPEISRDLFQWLLNFMEDPANDKETKVVALGALAYNLSATRHLLDDSVVKQTLGRILMSGIDQGLFTLWRSDNRSLRHLLTACMVCLPHAEPRSHLERICKQLVFSAWPGGYGLVLRCLDFRTTPPEFGELSRDLLSTMLFYKLEPDAECFYNVIKTLLSQASPEREGGEENMRHALGFYHEARRRGQDLAANLYVSLLMGLAKYIHPGTPYAGSFVNVASDVVSYPPLLSVPLAQTILRAFLRLRPTDPPEGFPHAAPRRGHEIHRIWPHVKRLEGIDKERALGVLLACFARTAPDSGEVTARRLIDEFCPDPRDPTRFNMLASVFVFLKCEPPTEALLRDLAERGLRPSPEFVYAILACHLSNSHESTVLRWFEIMPDHCSPDIRSLEFEASCRVGRTDLCTERLASILGPSPLSHRQYQHLLDGLGAVVHAWVGPRTRVGLHATPSWALRQMDRVLLHMYRTGYIGPRAYLHSRVVKAGAAYVRSARPGLGGAEGYLKLMEQFEQLIASEWFVVDDAVVCNIFGAMANVAASPPLVPRVLADMDYMEQYMLESRTKTTAVLFASRFRVLGITKSYDRLEAAYSKFILLCRDGLFPDQTNIPLAFNTYVKYSLNAVDAEGFFDTMVQLGVVPTASTFSLLIRNLKYNRRPADDLKRILRRLRKFQSSPLEAPGLLTDQLIKEIAAAAYAGEGARGMSDAVDYVLCNPSRSQRAYHPSPRMHSLLIHLALRRIDHESLSVALEWLEKLSQCPATDEQTFETECATAAIEKARLALLSPHLKPAESQGFAFRFKRS